MSNGEYKESPRNEAEQIESAAHRIHHNLLAEAMKTDALLTDDERWEKMQAWTRAAIAVQDKENADFVADVLRKVDRSEFAWRWLFKFGSRYPMPESHFRHSVPGLTIDRAES